MAKLNKNDLTQISLESLQRRTKEEVIHLSLRLRDQLFEALERLNQDSSNSSKPPSSDNPFKGKKNGENSAETESKTENTKEPKESDKSDNAETPKGDDDSSKRNPGRQLGAKGYWRKEKPEPDKTEHHFPRNCVICGRELQERASPHSAHYTYELEKSKNGAFISCTLHCYYSDTCECGHENIEKPGEGHVSVIEGRKRNLRLTEHNFVGPMFCTFIATLNRRYGMSRKKIREFLGSWFDFELSEGTICNCIREAGVACYPIVEDLIEKLQDEETVHMDETTWKEKGVLCWLWVAITKRIAVYHVGTRKKEELLKLITEAFFGWLVTDGFFAYRSHEKRQRCLAHLIRKAVGLTGAINKEVQKKGDWFLRELRGLIKAMAQGEDGKKECGPILARLKRACNLGSKSDHPKLKSLAREILNDWDAVVAFVKNPELPPTNNEAERALRQAVIFRKITFGTRTNEGSRSYAAFLSVFETCKLRGIDPYEYIAQVIASGRKGIAIKMKEA